jgi:hypothetical protein
VYFSTLLGRVDGEPQRAGGEGPIEAYPSRTVLQPRLSEISEAESYRMKTNSFNKEN